MEDTMDKACYMYAMATSVDDSWLRLMEHSHLYDKLLLRAADRSCLESYFSLCIRSLPQSSGSALC